MKHSKDEVATHEAGHLLAVLATPLKGFVVHACIYRKDDEWRGAAILEGERNKADPVGMYEFAKDLAGPVTQLHFYRESAEEDFAEVFRRSKGVLDAARQIVEKKSDIKTHWWPDLDRWTRYCRRCLEAKRPICAENYFEVEEAIKRVLTQDSAKKFVRDLAVRLEKEDCLSRDELLAIPTKQLPKFAFPNDLPL